jgi:hypothetical protein
MAFPSGFPDCIAGMVVFTVVCHCANGRYTFVMHDVSPFTKWLMTFYHPQRAVKMIESDGPVIYRQAPIRGVRLAVPHRECR